VSAVAAAADGEGAEGEEHRGGGLGHGLAERKTPLPELKATPAGRASNGKTAVPLGKDRGGGRR